MALIGKVVKMCIGIAKLYNSEPNSETERALVDAKRRLVNFARSDGDVEVEE